MTQAEHEGFLFLSEDEPEQEILYSEYWDVLIVDDDPEIHSVTQLALSGVLFWDKPLRFHHAYSGKEAVEYLSTNHEIAVVLLDVVMETDDAGLSAVKKIRDDLHNHNVRIILRTGQPGYAPEESIIRQYDINDYKTKTELTRSKLVTSLITAIRSFQQLREMEKQSNGLKDIITASKAILGISDIKDFSKAVITQLADVLGCESSGVLCSVIDSDDKVTVLGGSSEYNAYFGLGVEQLDNGRIIHQVQQCLLKRRHQQTEHDITFLTPCSGRNAAIYLELNEQLSDSQLQFAEIFLTNVSVGFDNVKLIDRLKDAAYTDSLTGLSNRTDFIEKIGLFAAKKGRNHRLYLIDIEKFSDINNGLGQDVGNMLLQAVSSRLQTELPSAQIIARIGADVFAIVIERNVTAPQYINQLLSLPFRAGEHLLPINFSLGVCEEEYFAPSGLQTLKTGYIALNLAKSQSQFNYEFYLPEMEERMTWRLGIIRQLRQDFSDGKLQVWYQPQIDLVTKKVIGCEALLRWPTDNGQFISPAVFVPLAEYSGLIVDIGQWVLDQACQQQKQLETLGYKIRMAVNVSVPQFRNIDFVKQVKQTMEEYQVEPGFLELEVTESIVMDDSNAVIAVLTELKSLGIEIAIDDFGTGFSSLSYLQKLPLDRIKIDRAFIKDIPDVDAEAIAELIISLGKKMKFHTIAEGIETQAQADYLIKAGCEEAQGFMYSKPLPSKDLIEFLHNYPN